MRFTILLAVAVLLGAPAGAFDLTGTWEGGFKCKGFDGLKFKISTKTETFQISQTGNALNVEWVGVAALEGIGIPDANKPDQKGSVALIDCDTTTDLTDPTGYAEIYDLQVKIDRVKGKGKLKGKSIWSEDGDTTGECKWSFKLINLADPAAPGCP